MKGINLPVNKHKPCQHDSLLPECTTLMQKSNTYAEMNQNRDKQEKETDIKKGVRLHPFHTNG
jgi:hypothetical protein